MEKINYDLIPECIEEEKLDIIRKAFKEGKTYGEITKLLNKTEI